ncbi:LCP family protein [Raoultibacter massiliensis]|uniref:LCP family protein n=1 Tax=Raoultibacter massiliensis TaxID=1852371 RepID=A0ABV1JCQ3_9ACTN|nr:LCP family protein [Raoultibacter massiliensis]
MAYKRRKISASHSNRTSRKLRDATIGTHVPSSARKTPGRASGSSVEFSNPRKSVRAQRGIVDHVLPTTSTRESDSAYSRRVSQRDFADGIQRKARFKGIAIALAVVLLVVCVAGGVGIAAYFGSVSDKMSLGDSNAKSALVAPAEGDAPYTLLVGEFSRAGQDYEGPDMLMLVRVDSESKQVTLVSVPANAQVSLSDGNAHRIADAQLLGGDEYLVSTVASFTGVNVSHLIKTDAEGLESLVDYLGGLTVDIGQEVDDPNAGDTYIPAGTQTLDGKTVLTLCRALNFAEGDETRAENQQKVVLALAEKLLQTNAFSIIPTLDAIAGTVRTDYSASDAMGLIDSLRGVDLSRVHAVRMPGYALTSSTTGAEYFIASEDEWAAMLEAIEAGEDPTPADETALSVDPASFKITVRNGSGITGGAQQMADSLAEGGFQVTETGNADQYVYNETLVVYQDDAYKEAAESVVKYLGTGRAVPSNGFYAFETDVLVMLGKDWQPLN